MIAEEIEIDRFAYRCKVRASTTSAYLQKTSLNGTRRKSIEIQIPLPFSPSRGVCVCGCFLIDKKLLNNVG